MGVVVIVAMVTQAVVSFIDYGNIQTVETKELRGPLPHPLFELPSQAMSTQLKDIPPPQVIS